MTRVGHTIDEFGKLVLLGKGLGRGWRVEVNDGLSSVSFHFEPCGFEKGNEIGGTVVVSMREGDQPVRLAAPLRSV